MAQDGSDSVKYHDALERVSYMAFGAMNQKLNPS